MDLGDDDETQATPEEEAEAAEAEGDSVDTERDEL